jgi:hypothetical protein
MPVGKMSVHIDFDEEKRTPVSQHLELLFGRDALLANFDNWHRLVKPYLAAMPEFFPIRQHVENMMASLNKIQIGLITADLPALLDSFRWLDKLMLEASSRGGTPNVGRQKQADDDPDMEEIEFADFPIEMMEFIRRPLLKLGGLVTG